MTVPPHSGGDGDDFVLDAGVFSEWLADTQAAIDGGRDADVPCGACTACCTSSQFVHIGPDEVDTLAHIPARLRFPAPRLPRGHVLLGYDERGHCPMLIQGSCSIYAHRPRTCRTYDCRVFPAAGVEVDEADKVLIAERVRRWRFSHPTPADQVRHDAVRAAAAFLIERAESLGDHVKPVTSTQRAVTAVEIYELFLEDDGPGGEQCISDPEPAVVRVELTRRRRIPPENSPQH